MATSLWTEWTRAVGDVLAPVHLSIKREVHRVHVFYPFHFRAALQVDELMYFEISIHRAFIIEINSRSP